LARKYTPIVERYWYSIDWDVRTIWALDLPVHTSAMAPLLWHMNVPVWPDANGFGYRVTPAQVIGNKQEHKREMLRIEQSDLSFPIDIFPHGRRLMILDGIHRLAKAVLLAKVEMSVRYVPESAVRRLWITGS